MQESILILGAGRSSGSLIDYLGRWSAQNSYTLIVADIDKALALEKTKKIKGAMVVQINPNDSNQLDRLIANAAIVISLLPAHLHPVVAKLCLLHYKNLATASYVADEIREIENEVKEKGLTFLFELGVDPGIDHMSAIQMIDNVKEKKAEILSFKSFSGALLAPETEVDNPWHYKFTWNPRNVIMIGQNALAQYRTGGKNYFVPYYRLFSELWSVNFPSLGDYSAYANRNSLQYERLYNLQNVAELIRGTLRRPGFCEAWNALIHLGATHNNTKITVPKEGVVRDFFSQLIKNGNEFSDKKSFEMLIGFSISDIAWQSISFLELSGNTPLQAGSYTPAEVLEMILLDKWKLKPQDKDCVVMYHELTYKKEGQIRKKISRMVMTGKNAEETAISSTVGLPLAMGVKLLLQGRISQKGVVLPVHKEIYEPILEELQEFGITFKEVDSEV
jgi:saccharopine dehydrogenase-like NADP-dependent oxidoreductase